MHVLVFGRTLPTKTSGSLGLFEFEQARALSKYAEVGYLFLETSSLLSNSNFKKMHVSYHDINTVGYYIPLGSFLGKIYRDVRYKLFIKAYQTYEDSYGKPDIIHVHFPTLVLTSGIIEFIESKDIILIATEHWTKVQQKKISEKQKALVKHLRSTAKKIICVSEELKKSIQELTNDDSEKNIIVIPNMISDEFFKAYKKEKQDKFSYTYIGRLAEIKRVDLLIDSFQDAFACNDRVKLNIVGDGPDRKKLEKQVKAEYRDQIIFWGNVPKDKVYEILTKSDVYVSASHYESFGVPFIEALAMGIPVIASSNMPIIIYLNEHKGVIFQDEDKDDLSRKMTYMYENIEDFSPERVNSGICEKFHRDNIAKKIIEVYEE